MGDGKAKRSGTDPAPRLRPSRARWMPSVAWLYAIVFLDQLTKELVLRRLDYGDGIVVIPGVFDLRHVRNTGAAWGMLSGAQPFLVLISLGMLIFLLLRGPRLFERVAGGPVWLGVLGGGVSGNLVDRLRLGYVVDFLDFHWKGAHFPAFNVADSAIFIAVVAWMIAHHLPGREPDADDPRESSGTGKDVHNPDVRDAI